jgi:hypothetical protein
MKIAVFCVVALMMEAAKTSETLVNFYQTTRCYNPEDSNLQLIFYVHEAEMNHIPGRRNSFVTKPLGAPVYSKLQFNAFQILSVTWRS